MPVHSAGGKTLLERETYMPQEPQAIPASQLESLFHAERIERTMYLLFHLNHWAKARNRLFFADRQGLYGVKAAIIRQAYARGVVSIWCYIDGSAAFGEELAFDMAADRAAQGCLWRLEEPGASSPGELEDSYDQIAHRLYTRITGNTSIVASEVEALELGHVRAYILARLHELAREAREARRPIPCAALGELCIAPGDLLSIQGRRYYELRSWDQLDQSDLRKLDPEGLSLVAFRYASSAARYVFHLPLRLAEGFVPTQVIEQMKLAPRVSRESGEYYGRAVSEVGSLHQPIAQILQEMGINVPATCPRLLSDKQEFGLAQSIHFATGSEEEVFDEDEEEMDEEFWQSSAGSSHEKDTSAGRREPDACPLCHVRVDSMFVPARLEHWQTEHSASDLIFCQASWVLGGIKTPGQITGKKEFCQLYPPDYRTPHKKGHGTRYWRAKTLRGWLETADQESRE